MYQNKNFENTKDQTKTFKHHQLKSKANQTPPSTNVIASKMKKKDELEHWGKWGNEQNEDQNQQNHWKIPNPNSE